MVEKISDEDAIKGMPMLLEGDASDWWRGVKYSATTFDGAIKMLRDAFSPPKPAWRIYSEIFESKQQKTEATDGFIRKKRALFAQLKPSPQEKTQIDIVFGMLHTQIREKVLRHNINTFAELLINAREAEQSLLERSKAVNIDVSNINGPARCSFCRKKGHSAEKCFKKQKQEEEVKQTLLTANTVTTSKPRLACYGCKAPGYVRANCPTCSGKPPSATGFVNFNSLSLSTAIGSDIPIVNIQLFGVPGQAFFGTGARRSVASSNLKRIMDMQGCTYNKVKCEVSLADGSKSLQECLLTICKIVLGGRSLNIKFIILPDATNNRTLLGADFLEQAGVVLNMGQKCWHFENNPDDHFNFAESWPLKLNLIESMKVPEDSKRKPERLKSEPKHSCREDYISEFENYGPEIRGNHYSPHIIQSIFQDCLPINMQTPERDANDNLFSGVVYVGYDDDAAHLSLDMVDFKIIKSTDAVLLTEKQKENLDHLLSNHDKVFGSIEEPTPYAEHTINTADHPPISSPPYRLSFAKTLDLKSEVNKLQSMGIVKECESAWTSPVVMVPKKGGGIRLCIDYRKINAVTIPDKYPLPRMDDLLHAAKSTKYMTTLDLQSGYYQIKINEKDADKTCFTTPFGLFRFTRMPFGLRNAPATFQRLIDRFKSGIPGVTILAYLDDLIVCSPSFNDHLNDLTKVFERLDKFKLRVNNEKCHFCCAEVKYLGHILTKHGICADPEKTSAIAERKEPRNVKELISFLQTCSWYRKFINRYADIAKPLTDLTKKNKSWSWNEAQKNAFHKLKEALITAPVLKQAQDGLPFTLKTDASAYALGAVLLQGEGHEEHPIEFASRLLTSPEINYSTTEREALAIVWACAKYRGYIKGAEVTLATDHQPLKRLLRMKSPSGSLARCALQLQPYNFKIEYTPGKSNVIADMLSRPPVDETIKTNALSFQIDFPRKTVAEIRSGQLKDEYLKAIITSLESTHENINRWVNRGYLMNDGVLYCYSNEESEDAQVVVPEKDRLDILKTYHDDSTAGHYGIERTTARIATRYFWPNMRSDIAKHVKTCIDCQRYKATNLKSVGLLQTTSSKHRFEVIAVDLFGPLPQTEEGLQWILIIEDVASRWVEIFALKEATAEICAKLLIEEIFLRYGLPRRIKSDNGVQFISAIFQKLTYCLGIQQQFTPIYHPEANPVERKHRDMKAQLAILVQAYHNSWAKHLPAIRFAMNTAKCQSTGFTAALLTFGRELRTLEDVQHDVKTVVEKEPFNSQITQYLHDLTLTLKRARENEQRLQDRNQILTNQHRRHQNGLKVGTEVLVNTHVLSQAAKGITTKFVPKRDGPYVIIRRVGSTTFEIAARDNLNVSLFCLTVYKKDETEQAADPVNPLRRRGRPRKQ